MGQDSSMVNYISVYKGDRYLEAILQNIPTSVNLGETSDKTTLYIF